VLVSTTTKDCQQIVTVLPVTHTLTDERLAVEIPSGTKASLGLDDARSWIVLNEANRFRWPGPDRRTVPGDKEANVAYGLLPTRLYEQVRTKWVRSIAPPSLAWFVPGGSAFASLRLRD
jgi:hypothetical protein